MIPREGKTDLMFKWILYAALIVLIIYAEVTK